VGKLQISLTVNDRRYSLEVDPSLRLVDLLRDVLGFTSVKEGCSEGECGACTVLMDGKAVTSCTIMAFQADGSEILTVEGLESRGELEPIEKAFIENDAVQCGFCTPGMIMSTKALLDKNRKPAEEDAKRAIEGNLCRCTGYVPIIKSILAAAERMEEDAGKSS
jgi:carbon-monoxide dehydrogenase small subunit